MTRGLKSWLGDRHEGIPAWRSLLWLAIMAGIALVAGFWLFPSKQAGRLIKHFGYYGIAGTFAWWLWVAGNLAWERGLGKAEWWRARVTRQNVQAAVLILVLTLIAVFTVPRIYKVMFDEAVIQSTSWNMHMEREIGALNRAHVIDGLMRSLETYLDKRPYFFPFLVSLLHDFTGYREQNAFWLNTSLMPVILALAYRLGRGLGAHAGGMAAAAGLGAFSLLAINACGAGLEMLNLALILGLMAAGLAFLEKPDEGRMALLVLTAILLANTRYEASIYIGSVALIVLEGWRRAGRVVLPLAAICAPLLLVPYALHNTYLAGTPKLWELKEGATSRFAMQFLEQNLKDAGTYFFNVQGGNVQGLIANSIWLTMGGIVAGGVVGVWAWKRKPRWPEWSPVSVSVVLCALGAWGNLALLMAYYWGDLSDPVVSRLSLPFQATLALLIAAAVGRLPGGWRKPAGAWAVALACLSYVAFGVGVNQSLGDLNSVETTQRWEFEVLRRRGPANRVIITDKSPLSWFVREVPAVMPGRLVMNPDGLPFHLRHHSFDEVLVTQTLQTSGVNGDFMTPDEHKLPAGYVLETLAERRVGSKIRRISRLVEIKADEIKVDEAAPAPVSSPAVQKPKP